MVRYTFTFILVKSVMHHQVRPLGGSLASATFIGMHNPVAAIAQMNFIISNSPFLIWNFVGPEITARSGRLPIDLSD